MEIYFLSPFQLGFPRLGEEGTLAECYTFVHVTSGSLGATSNHMFLFSQNIILSPFFILPRVDRSSENWISLRILADIKLYLLALEKNNSPQAETKESHLIPLYL